jgi:hypothetical protein
LEHYIGLCVGNRKNNFPNNFINNNFDSRGNISFYGVPDKINADYIVSTKRHNPEYLITDAKQLI